MGDIKDFILKAALLFIILVACFAFVQPFTSCGGDSVYSCFKTKASELLPHRHASTN
jgi:hypothetical protein